jgi:glucose/arabinose dehydrogenase
MRGVLPAIVVAGLAGGCPQQPFAPPEGLDPPVTGGSEIALTVTLVASGLSRPVFVTAPANDFDRVFILEQHTGRIRILNLRTLEMNDTPFITIPNLATGNEQGLLGMAFAPDYDSSGRFYVNYTRRTGLLGSVTEVARGTVSTDPDVANTSLDVILSFTQPFSNHNGGWIGFGPDRYLYIATGDGGSANDPGDRSQNVTDQRLGKLLRIDVSAQTGFTVPADNPFVGIDGDDAIWAFGLRNPWRCSFDRDTGDLYIADVGQGSIEEMDFQPADSSGGENYGWPCMEGRKCLGSRPGCTCDADALTAPIYEYTHGSGCSVTGGYVYSGSAIPDLQGTYFFADFCSNLIMSFRYDGSEVTELTDRTRELDPIGDLSIGSISSFGEDAEGELYICDLFDGEVFKIVPAVPETMEH